MPDGELVGWQWRYVGLPLLDPAYPQLPPTAWHERVDPGAELLAWLTRSRWIG